MESLGKRKFKGRTEDLGRDLIQEEANRNDECENTAGIFFTWRTIIYLQLPEDDSDCRKSCGFHLTRSKWDPYPWVGFVESGSIAESSGLRAGDCLLEIDGVDVVGLRVKEIASLIKKDPGSTINLQVWRNIEENDFHGSEDGVALSGPLPTLARKLAKALSGTVQALECPICLETATSPVSQCVHGHILCGNCRSKTPRCPVCRVRLGQGRCLLADEVQRKIKEAFEDSMKSPVTIPSSPNSNGSLRERLFGKVGRKNSGNAKDSNASGSTKRMSLARLLLGGFDKAMSAENLATNLGEPKASCPRLGELSQSHRTKSASTGELSRNQQLQIKQTSLPLSDGKPHQSSWGHLSVPQTPTWGGSTESMATSDFPCPLAAKSNCNALCSYDNYIDHLGRTHSCPQVHFWGPNAMIPIPLPFGEEAVHILHYENELFFFKYENETAWLTSTGGNGEWILHGGSSNGTEIKLRRSISKITDSTPPLNHLAPLPRALGITIINIELVQHQPEALNI